MSGVRRLRLTLFFPFLDDNNNDEEEDEDPSVDCCVDWCVPAVPVPVPVLVLVFLFVSVNSGLMQACDGLM